MLKLQKQTQTYEEALKSYLNFVYTSSHSNASIKAYRTAIAGDKSELRIFLQQKYNCNEVQLVTRIKNQDLNVYKVLRNYVIFLDKREIKPKNIRS